MAHELEQLPSYIGFPIVIATFCTVDEFLLAEEALADSLAVLENEGYMRHLGRRLKKGKNLLLTSHIAISTNIVLSIR